MRDNQDLAHPAFRQDVGDGLLLRWSTAADTERIADLHSIVHRPSADAPRNERIQARIRLLMRGDAPVMGPQDYAVVEDTTRAGQPIIACACLWHHTWEFAGIPLGVGRPEYVAADPTYRRRGLIRAIFAIVHARSAAVGHQIQAITGISHFYRQFGYEYALDLEGMRLVQLAQIPAVPASDEEPYRMRDATVADIPHLLALHAQRRTGALVWSVLPTEHWRYQIVELAEIGSPDKGGGLKMITDRAGAVVGYLHVGLKRWGPHLGVYAFETVAGVNLRAVALSVLRALALSGQHIPNIDSAEPLRAIELQLGREHPVYEALGPTLTASSAPPYAWYVRVPDVAGFLRLVTPVLEHRLTGSVLADYTGELKLDWYRGGLRLVFDQGKLAIIDPWQAPFYGEEANAGCPALVFLQLLFGYRTLDELCYAFPDVWAHDEARLLLDVLFPKLPSYVVE